MDLEKLIGKTIVHKKYGNGTIVTGKCKNEDGKDKITVQFACMQKEFEYIVLFSSGGAQMIPELEDEIKADIEAAAEAERVAREEAHRTREANRQETQVRVVGNRNRSPRANEAQHINMAFRCNYCDGGCSSTRLGFAGACSEENLKRNVTIKKHSQCQGNSKCAEYVQGKCSYTDVVASVPLCYESEMLTMWRAAAGMNLKGNKVKQGRSIAAANRVELVILTTRLPGEDEEEKRVIFAVFLADEYESDAYREKAGYVQSNNESWRIELTPDEAKKMRFWDYYSNRSGSTRWNMSLFCHITNEQALRVLNGIIEIKKDPAEKARAQAVLDEYKRRTGQI